MAKKKTRNTKKKEKPSYLVELYGLLLILIAILGIGKYGPVGRFIAGLALFLVGNLYFFLLIAILIIGIYIIVNRESIKLFSSKMVGIYLIVIALLALMHLKYAVVNIKSDKIFTETIEYLMDGIGKIMSKQVRAGIFNHALANTGGGILGALFISLFYSMFEAQGAEIVVWLLLAVGIMIFTGFSIKDLLAKGKDAALSFKSKTKEPSDDGVTEEHSKFKIVDHNDDKLVVHDIKELTKPKEEKVVEVQPQHENINKSYILPLF